MDRQLFKHAQDWGRRRQSLVGLVVVLVMIGHDALMAGDAHATPRHDAGHGVAGHGASTDQVQPRHQAGTQQASASSFALGDGTTAPHPASCATIRAAVPRVGGDDGRDGPAIGVGLVVVRLNAAPPTAEPCWQNPTQPPRTRRALLQVYRI